LACPSAIALDARFEESSAGHAKPAGLNLVHADPIVAAFRHSLPFPPESCPVLADALRHVLAAPGSLIRMRVAYPLAESFGMESHQALHAATALEYFHTASLVLDDLPCMDDAAERRGEPCVHRVYGEHEAILVALALINRAYALTWGVLAECEGAVTLRGMAYLEQLLGLSGLLSGQSRDLNYASQAPSAANATLVAKGKTVSLIRLSLVWPALLAGAGARELQLLERVALYWGLAYQAADDLKDVLANSASSGKTAARDALLHRPNMALVLGSEKAFACLERLLSIGDGFFSALLRLRPGLQFLEELRTGLDAQVRDLNCGTGQIAEGPCA